MGDGKIDSKQVNVMARRPTNGVFWITDEGMLAFPFRDGAAYGVAKSGFTFNHRLLWREEMGVKGKPYDYFPRGRVEVNNRGNAVVYLSPHIDIETWLPAIKEKFGISEEDVVVHQDHSDHYRCYLDSD